SIADKGIVFTSDKDQNILSKIELADYIYSINTLSIHQNFYSVKEIFLQTNQQVIPIISEENEYMGILEYHEVKHILFDDFECKYAKIQDYIKKQPTILQKSSTSYTLRFMDEQKQDYAIVTHQKKVVGIVYRNKLMEKYRENLINLRIE